MKWAVFLKSDREEMRITMLILEIIMVLVGLGAVVLGYKMTEEKGKQEEMPPDSLPSMDVRELQNQLEELKEKAEVVFEETDEKISALMNEKIMGISEYSEQVLDKIEKNHAEVVFLYDMMNKKQEEIKQSISEIDEMKADVRNEAAKEYQKLKEQEEILEEMRKEIQLESVEIRSGYQKLTGEVQQTQEKQVEIDDAFYETALDDMDTKMREFVPKEEDDPFAFDTSEIYDAEIARIEAQEEAEAKKRPEKEQLNRNEEILSLYKKGRSVLDISKMLGMGQGEVKFVIDLYEAR